MNNSDGTPRRDRRGYASQLLGEEHSSNFLLINSRAGPSELRRENGLRTSRANPSLSSEEDSLVTTLSRSDVTFAKNFLESAINESVVVIHGNVSVQYSGRASSRANLAPRIVIKAGWDALGSRKHEEYADQLAATRIPIQRFCPGLFLGS